jgi:purine-binding chemotaxis protein CheW
MKGTNAMEEQETKKEKYVTFMSGSECYGIKIDYVNEIIVNQEITKVPETPEYIKGLINLRGKIIPVIDVRLRFKQKQMPYNDRTCIVVISVGTTVVGLIVEKIADVVELGTDDILPAPTIASGDKADNTFVCGIGKINDTVKLLLDPDKLLNEEELSRIEHSDDTELEKGE